MILLNHYALSFAGLSVLMSYISSCFIWSNLFTLHINCTHSYDCLLVLVCCPVNSLVSLFGVLLFLFTLLSLCRWIGFGPSSGLLSQRCMSLLPLVWICEFMLCFIHDPITPLLVMGLSEFSSLISHELKIVSCVCHVF